MRKNLFKTITTLTTALSLACMISTPVLAKDLKNVSYDFDKAWNNKGNAEVVHYLGSPEDLISIKYGSYELTDNDYILSRDDYYGTHITIKQESLEKLPLKYGINEFTVEVKGNKNTSFIHSIHTLGNNENTIIVPKDDSIEFLSIANISGCMLSVLWDYWYTMTETDDSYIIKLSDEYLNKYAKSNEYYTYCLENYTFTLDLVKGEMGDVNCDEKVDLEDTKVALQATLGIIEETTEIKQLGDMDGDGKLSLTDTASVLKTALAIK